jgi:hypothetical protein
LFISSSLLIFLRDWMKRFSTVMPRYITCNIYNEIMNTSPCLLSNGYQGSFSGGKAAGAWSWPLISN